MAQEPTELWQAFDEQGEPVADGITKKQSATGILHGASHVWIWRGRGQEVEILLQRRANTIRTWPGYLDGTGGHVDQGETPLRTALREVREELGLQLGPKQLKLLFVDHLRLPVTNTPAIIENEFQWVYGLHLDADATVHLTKGDGEVAATQWVSLQEFEQLAFGTSPLGKIIPHGKEYFEELLRSILEDKNYGRHLN